MVSSLLWLGLELRLQLNRSGSYSHAGRLEVYKQGLKDLCAVQMLIKGDALSPISKGYVSEQGKRGKGKDWRLVSIFMRVFVYCMPICKCVCKYVLFLCVYVCMYIQYACMYVCALCVRLSRAHY